MVERINDYKDQRFRQKILNQHGAYICNNELYEIEIISSYEAIVYGNDKYYLEVIEEFRYYAEHITLFYNQDRKMIIEYPRVELIDLPLIFIQPSQFYIDQDKKEAVKSFILTYKDIIIPVLQDEDCYIALDGHTRLKVAVDRNYTNVKGLVVENNDWVLDFVKEARRRGIRRPYDLIELNHEEYEVKWNQYCDQVLNDKKE